MDEADVVVVGAGLAGLTAAQVLQGHGHSVAVLEARERPGGRLLSKQIGGATFDVGGQWIGPNHWRMRALVRELGLQTFPTRTQGESVLHLAGRRTTYRGTIPRIAPWKLAMLQNAAWAVDRLARRSATLPAGSAAAARLDSMTLATWSRRMIPSTSARNIMNAGLKVVFGADPAELSLLWCLQYIQRSGGIMPLLETRGGAQDTRFVAGAQEVPIRIARALHQPPYYRAPVRTITQDDQGVVVATNERRWRAQRVVIAVPPALTGQISFAPSLPSTRAQLVQRMPMGATIKALAIYESAFWREDGLSGEAVMTNSPISVIFDNSSHDDKVFALVGFCVGQDARDLAALPPNQRREQVLAAFSQCFGARAADALIYEEQDWQAEVWSRGCPTGNFGPGTLHQFAPALREPVGRIHWAGTETATEFVGFMEGAVQSGHRAGEAVARELI
ncbi:MAG: FAD-dependent oxidoreductase [Actinomycetia bacterium]|nr:FAD-dependent oxidoreductase [Actinomycetes bacterium]